LQEYPGKHLVIIAGIGANLMSQFINDIHQKYPDMNIDFLLCPVNQQFALREKLIALKFSLKNEVLVKDNCRYYEVILVSSTSDTQKEISPVGHNIWQSVSAEQASVVKQYLDKTLKHYKRVQQGSTVDIAHIISAYNSKT